MAQADRVHSTPPTNTSATTPKSSRRSFLVQAAGVAAGGAAIGAGLPLPAPSVAAQTITHGRKYGEADMSAARDLTQFLAVDTQLLC
jgi:hypothetical protein